MNDHLSNSQITMFQARALPSAEMIAVLEHLAQCIHCRQRSHEHFLTTNSYQVSTITLSPTLQWRHEHLDAEQITAFVNRRLEREEEEIVQAHLQTCPHCRTEVQDWRSFQEELQRELHVRYGPKPVPKPAWQWKALWPAWQWKPLLASLLVAVGVLTTILIIQNQANRKAPSPIVTAIPSPTTSAIQPSPSIPPATSPTPLRVMPEETVIASLRDGTGIIAVTKEGSVEGVPAVAEELRGDLIAALRTGNLHQPAILQDLASDGGAVRGKGVTASSSKLLTPVGITVLTDRPVLHWQPVKKATGYEVQIADGRGNEVAQSEILSASTSRWQLPQPLNRGVIYTWTVRVLSEDSTSADMPPTSRFKVLEATKAGELARLKKQTNSHLVLGLFYIRAGMLPEAQLEFKSLAHQNLDSPIARKLLQSIQMLR